MDDQPSLELAPTCGQCYHWGKLSGEAPYSGICWRNPPQVIPVQQKTALGQVQFGVMNARPTLAETERACGEFEPIDTPDLVKSGYP